MTVYLIHESICKCGIFREASLSRLDHTNCPDCGQLVKANYVGTQRIPFQTHFLSRFGVVQKYLESKEFERKDWKDGQPEDATVAHCGRVIEGRVMPKI